MRHPLLAGLLSGLMLACQGDFVQIAPQGYLDTEVLATPEGVDALLIGAYALLDGVAAEQFGWESAASNWIYGSIRGLEANSGSDAGDSSPLPPLVRYAEGPTNGFLLLKWRSLYEGVARANAALRALALAEARGTVEPPEADRFRAQARALRGHYHFEAWKLFGQIPYVTEDAAPWTHTNTVDIRAQVLDDLRAGLALPDNMGQPGRFNGTVARVLLAKALMHLQGDFAAARPLLEAVVTGGTRPDGGPIGLEARYGDVFDLDFRNGPEAIYTVQYAVNDGSGGWNGGWGEVLNFPYKAGASPGGGCCGFFQPSFSLVHAFRTRDGLPLLDGSYLDQPVLTDQGLAPGDTTYVEDPGPLDPRLDWTVGRRGIPYLDWGEHTGRDWIRSQAFAGPFSPKKQVYRRAQEAEYTEQGSWTGGFTANGYRMIRYADVLLLLAECALEMGDLGTALTHINTVRTRAANPDGFVKEADGVTPAAAYDIRPYPAFPDQAYARRALQMERLLELGMEGHRFFDLRRWGIAEAELNRLLAYEATQLPYMYAGASLGPEDLWFPIPQREIDLSQGRLVQNR